MVKSASILMGVVVAALGAGLAYELGLLKIPGMETIKLSISSNSAPYSGGTITLTATVSSNIPDGTTIYLFGGTSSQLLEFIDSTTVAGGQAVFSYTLAENDTQQSITWYFQASDSPSNQGIQSNVATLNQDGTTFSQFEIDTTDISTPPDTQVTISGTTEDSIGNAIGSQTVYLWVKGATTYLDKTTSDSNGKFSFTETIQGNVGDDVVLDCENQSRSVVSQPISILLIAPAELQFSSNGLNSQTSQPVTVKNTTASIITYYPQILSGGVVYNLNSQGNQPEFYVQANASQNIDPGIVLPLIHGSGEIYAVLDGNVISNKLAITW